MAGDIYALLLEAAETARQASGLTKSVEININPTGPLVIARAFGMPSYMHQIMWTEVEQARINILNLAVRDADERITKLLNPSETQNAHLPEHPIPAATLAELIGMIESELQDAQWIVRSDEIQGAFANITFTPPGASVPEIRYPTYGPTPIAALKAAFERAKKAENINATAFVKAIPPEVEDGLQPGGEQVVQFTPSNGDIRRSMEIYLPLGPGAAAVRAKYDVQTHTLHVQEFRR